MLRAKQYETLVLRQGSCLYLTVIVSAKNYADNSLMQIRDDSKMLREFRKSLEYAPHQIETWLMLGTFYKRTSRNDEAIIAYLQARKLQPNHPIVLNNLASAYIVIGELENALNCLEILLGAHPGFVAGWINRGLALSRQRKFIEAERCFNHALILKPEEPAAAKAKANLLLRLRRYGEAQAVYESIPSDLAKGIGVELSHAMCLLAQGHFTPGWEMYESRFAHDALQLPAKYLEIPEWDGSTKSSGNLIIWGEQGLGDQIMFSSILSSIIEFPGNVLCTFDARLIPLFERSYPNISYCPNDKLNIPWTPSAQIPLASMAKHFRRSAIDFKRDKAHYLLADATRVNELRKCFNISDKKLVGLSWKTSNKKNGDERSLSLEELLPLLQMPNFEFVSLQYGDVGDDIASVEKQFGISIRQVSNLDVFNDIDGLAALIKICEYVVTIDNSTAHLSGALGVKTLLLLPYCADWRWFGQDDGSTYWYNNVVLFRQLQIGDWGNPVHSMIEEIMKEID